MEPVIRRATLDDIPALNQLIAESVRRLQTSDYTPEQIEGALGTVYGTDRQMISDGTYYVAECGPAIAGCGGWSRRRTAFGTDHSPVRDDTALDPALEAAKIRAFFVHPDWARRGIATAILHRCEHDAREAGFTAFELTATLTGVALYLRYGYRETERLVFQLPNGHPYEAVRMRKAAHAAQA